MRILKTSIRTFDCIIRCIHTKSIPILRSAKRSDVPFIRCCNHICLDEHYEDSYIDMLITLWPELALIAECNVTDIKGISTTKVMGYVLGKVVNSKVAQHGEVYYHWPQRDTIGDYPLDVSFQKMQQTLFHEYQLKQLNWKQFHEQKNLKAAINKTETVVSPPVDLKYDANDMMGFVTSTAVYPEYRRLGMCSNVMYLVIDECVLLGRVGWIDVKRIAY